MRIILIYSILWKCPYYNIVIDLLSYSIRPSLRILDNSRDKEVVAVSYRSTPHIALCKNVVCLMYSCALFATHPGKGGYLELSLAWHHSPAIPISLVPSRGRKYHRNSPSSLWEVVRKYHYSWCVSSHNHANGCFNGCISSLRLFKLVIMALPISCFAFQPHRIRTQNTVYLVIKEQNWMTISPSY